MTFDIDKAMSERFAKGPGFVDTDEGKVDATTAAKVKEINDSYDEQELQARDMLGSNDDGTSDQLANGREKALADALQNADIMNEDGTVETPMAKPSAAIARLDKGGSSIAKDAYLYGFINQVLQDTNFNAGAAREALKMFEQALEEGEENPIYHNYMAFLEKMNDAEHRELPASKLSTSRNKQMQADKVLAKKAKKAEKKEDAEETEPTKKSFDIGIRMAQWDAAGRSQHVEDTETILRGGNPYVEGKRGREDFKDPENVFQFMEWMFGPFDYGQEQGYLRLKSALKNNPELARSLMAAIEQTTLQTEDFRGRGDSKLIPAKYQDAESGMNRIGADRPRQEAWDEISFTYPEPDGEGGYYSEEATVDEDVTEEKPGPTSRAKAAAEEAKGDSKDE